MSASLVPATVPAVSKRKLQPTRATLTLTPAAVNKIKQLLKDKPEHVGVKGGVRTRGCNGLSYTPEYTKTKGDSEEEVIQDGVRVFIEKKAQLTLLEIGSCSVTQAEVQWCSHNSLQPWTPDSSDPHTSASQ
uniref:Iron-sulfur cluster assembly 1 homolog, mitochondrial n=1 Tax=Callithrix jacchus TaxID=9483 RepID=A0A8I3X292_CALJA